ncbi:MAG: selenium cofactor biosynthesis protein YqeC [Syntrophobacteraceae bacterium]
MISLVGAGGKTTLMFCLAKWMADCGMRVVSTTTTKIFMPESSRTGGVVLEDSAERLITRVQKLLERHRHITAGAGYLVEQNKVKGLSTESVAALKAAGIADWIIVEADGAARRPLKAPAPHEPVIPAETICLVAVVGLVGVGKELDDRHVFRPDRFAALTGLLPGAPVTPSSVASALLHEEGIMKGAPAGACKIVFLNEAEQAGLRPAGTEVAAFLRQMGGERLQGIVIGSAAKGPESWDWQSPSR